jgi:hypothetical protein
LQEGRIFYREFLGGRANDSFCIFLLFLQFLTEVSHISEVRCQEIPYRIKAEMLTNRPGGGPHSFLSADFMRAMKSSPGDMAGNKAKGSPLSFGYFSQCLFYHAQKGIH